MLISYIHGEALRRELDYLWVFPINESIEKVYLKYGFETVGKFQIGHAFLGGKSIMELRE